MSKYLFSFAVITLALAIVFTIQRIDSAIFFDKPTPSAKIIFPDGVDIKNDIDLKKLKNDTTKRGFIADEYHLSWDLVDPSFTKIRVFELTYNNLDKFQYSCLNQVLDEKKIKRESKLIDKKHHVKITLKEQTKAENLLALLDSYDINGEFKEIFQFKDNLYNEK